MSKGITEAWLKDNGFRWDEPFEKDVRHWTLWLGRAREPQPALSDATDLGIELASPRFTDSGWSCWVRADYNGRYNRFVHVRYLRTTDEVVQLIEALTGTAFDKANTWYGQLLSADEARRRRKADEEDHHRKLARAWGQRVEAEGADPAKRELLRP